MKTKALMVQGEIMETTGENTAADRRVRLQATQAILGDESRGGGNGVNVTVNSGVQLTAGIVVRLPNSVTRTPLEDVVSEESKF